MMGPVLRQSGMGLVEIMVSLVVGMAMIAGGLSLYHTSIKMNRFNENTIRMIRAADKALNVVTDELKLAGYMGSLGSPYKIKGRLNDPEGTNNLVIGEGENVYELGKPLVLTSQDDALDWEPDASSIGDYYLPNSASDIIDIRRLSNRPLGTVGSPPSLSNTNYSTFVVTNRVQGEIFHLYRDARIDSNAISNIPDDYDDDALIYGAISRAFYVHAYDFSNVGEGAIQYTYDRPEIRLMYYVSYGTKQFTGMSGATITTTGGTIGEVANDIADLQIQVGLDTDGDKVPNYYVNPGDPDIELFPNVTARVWVTVQSSMPDNVEGPVSLSYADTTFERDNGFRYMVFDRTVRLINMDYD